MATPSNAVCSVAAHATVLLALASCAWADGKDDVAAAADKSFSTKTYSWVGKLADDPEVHAKTGADGLSSVVVTIDGKPQTAVLKDNVTSAALTPAGWKTQDEIAHDPKQFDLALWMADWSKRPPARNVRQWISTVPTLTAGPAGQYTGTYDPAEVARVLGGRHKGTTVTDARGTLTVTVTVKDGYVTQAERHLTAAVTTSDGTKPVDRQESFTLSDYNTTQPDVPDAAKPALAK